MTAEPEPRCPACGGRVHPVASRCKLCRADLTAARAQAGRESDASGAGAGVGHGAGAAAASLRARGAGSWRRSWPLVAAFAAVFALGVSAGVLIERWRQARRAEPGWSPAARGVSPRPVPDRMSPRVAPERPAELR